MIFFDGWQSVGRIVLLALCTYVLLIAALRVAGEQALAKMSAYDMVITIALGSIVATIPLSSGVTFTDGVAVVITYLLLQRLTRRALKRRPAWRPIIKDQPCVVLWDGALQARRMHDVDVTEGEVRAAVRKAGIGSLAAVQAVVLENDGQWSVIPRPRAHDLSAFAGLDVPRPGASAAGS